MRFPNCDPNYAIAKNVCMLINIEKYLYMHAHIEEGKAPLFCRNMSFGAATHNNDKILTFALFLSAT